MKKINYKRIHNRNRLSRLIACISQFFNVLLLNGNEDQTLAGHVGHKSKHNVHAGWQTAELVLDALFFFDPSHCRNALAFDEIRAYKRSE